ncbi:unnamed protein product [Soboliphyme baturini]|uniref:Biogenesis of lysosome-related organelles complex 1 subunit 8 n=1 Tax=Soboliphyme baturini TaxID=241478 RepID=A0A183J4Y3_9BILA|nr:unnamed protein product [Soboliphyme baturini]
MSVKAEECAEDAPPAAPAAEEEEVDAPLSEDAASSSPDDLDYQVRRIRNHVLYPLLEYEMEKCEEMTANVFTTTFEADDVVASTLQNDVCGASVSSSDSELTKLVLHLVA